MYQPDQWELVEINHDGGHFFKVFGSWSGGYLDGDSWRLNSGITGVREEEDFYYFQGASGSEYKCHKEGYGIKSPYNAGTLAQYKKEYPDKITLHKKMPDVMAIQLLEWEK